MYKYIHTCIYIHINVSTHIHTYTYIHTHIQNVHMNCTQARLERWSGSERARSRCRPMKLCTSLLFDVIKPHFTPPKQGLYCTRTLLYPRPAALISLHPPSPLPNIPQNSSKIAQFHNDPLRSCRKIGGRTVVHQSRSKRVRRNPSPRMIKVTVHEETRGQWKKRPNPWTDHT